MTQLQQASELESIIDASLTRFRNIAATEWLHKPAPGKWSKQEILGHLTDSAHVNYDRMIRIQLESTPKIVYQQDNWVAIQQYQDQKIDFIIQSWALLNKRLAEIWRRIPDENLDRATLWGEGEPVSLAYVISDYLVHLQHHLDQILGKP